jgi:subfamily B ATP-binding cassette protein MsbA
LAAQPEPAAASAPPPASVAVPATQTPSAIYARLMRYVRPHLGMFMLGVVGLAVAAGAEVGFLALMKRFLDANFVNHNREMLWFLPVGVVVLFFFRGVGDYVGNFAPGWVGRQVIKKLRADLFRHYLDLPVAYYDRSQSGQLLSLLTYNTELVADAATNAITVVIKDSLTLVGTLVFLFYVQWKLTLLALIAAPVIGWLIQKINRAFRRYASRIQDSMGDVTRVGKESIDGQRLIKVYNAQEAQAARFETAIERNRAQNMKLVNAKASSNPIIGMVSAIGLAIVMYAAILSVLHDGMTVGDFVILLGGLVAVTQPLRRLTAVFGTLQQGIAAGGSVFALLDVPAENAGRGRPLERAKGAIAFEGVTFAYAGKEPAVRELSLDVRPGEKVAIVGRSGSGKSTLVGLVPRFYDVTSGTVRVDGHDVREYDLQALRANVSLVSQDVVLMSGSIRDNIAFGSPGATPEAIERAARTAHVMEFVKDKPAGLDTDVGDRGVQLSGGQRQRIAIARAVLKDAPILILDEATSALDTESERIIADAFERLMSGRTTLVIAHRLSTIENADRIVVMAEGRIVEIGTHAELLDKGGHYAALHRMQFAE